MEYFSLEDDEEYNNLFITQTPKENVNGSEGSEIVKSNENDSFLGVNVTDFTSPCLSLTTKPLQSAQYSDISDEEFMPNLSQIR